MGEKESAVLDVHEGQVHRAQCLEREVVQEGQKQLEEWEVVLERGEKDEVTKARLMGAGEKAAEAHTRVRKGE